MTLQAPPPADEDSTVRVEDRFVAWIRVVCAQRGPRAALRRAAGRPSAQALAAMRFVEPWVHKEDHPSRVEALYTVAALIATHDTFSDHDGGPSPATLGPPGRSIGTAVARALAADGCLGENDPTFRAVERRLLILARADANTARRTLPRLFAHCAPLTPDYALLLRELAWWDTRQKPPGVDWLRHFYRDSSPARIDPASTSSS